MTADLKKDCMLVRFQWVPTRDMVAVTTIDSSDIHPKDHWPTKRMSKSRARVRWKFMLASGYERILPDDSIEYDER